MPTKKSSSKNRTLSGSASRRPRSTKQQKQRNRRFALFAALVTAVCGLVGVAVLLAAPANDGTRFVSGVGTGNQCLDNSRGTLQNGNTIMTYPCNTTAAQKWEILGDTIRPLGSAYCLDTDAKAGQSGRFATITRCNRIPSQRWKVNNTGTNHTIVDITTGKCLEVQNGSTEPRAALW